MSVFQRRLNKGVERKIYFVDLDFHHAVIYCDLAFDEYIRSLIKKGCICMTFCQRFGGVHCCLVWAQIAPEVCIVYWCQVKQWDVQRANHQDFFSVMVTRELHGYSWDFFIIICIVNLINKNSSAQIYILTQSAVL